MHLVVEITLGDGYDIVHPPSNRIALEDLVEQGFDTLINHKDTAVKVLVHP